MDNLTQHLQQLGIVGAEAAAAKNNYGKRKLTTEEHGDLRRTTMVKKKKNTSNVPDVTFDDFNFLMVIGRGTFGKVFLAE